MGNENVAGCFVNALQLKLEPLSGYRVRFEDSTTWITKSDHFESNGFISSKFVFYSTDAYQVQGRQTIVRNTTNVCVLSAK